MTEIGAENMIKRGGVIDRGKDIEGNNNIAAIEKGGGRVEAGREGKGKKEHPMRTLSTLEGLINGSNRKIGTAGKHVCSNYATKNFCDNFYIVFCS